MTLVKLASHGDIDKAIARMAVAFQRDIDAATIRIYRETLADLPLWAIEASELELRRTGGTFFPSAAVWHQKAAAHIEDKRREMLSRPASPEFECSECRDTGWVDVQREDRNVCIPCSCRPRNTNYQRMTANSRKANEDLE